MQPTLRRADEADLEACFAVQKAADLAAFTHIYPPDRYPFPDDAVRERWRENLTAADRHCLIAEEEGDAVGTAALIDCLFDSIAVVPERWGSSVAAQLHDAIIDLARTNGCDASELWVLELNTRARRFYAARGWVPTGETKPVPFAPNPLLLGYKLHDLARRAELEQHPH